MSQRNRFKELTAKKVPPITEAPAPGVDPEAQAIADRLMKQFGHKTNSEPTAPVAESVKQTELPKTMSLDPQRFEDLRNLKAAQEKLTIAERRCENLEKTLAHITDYVSQLVMRQQEVLNGCIGNLITEWQREYAVGELRIIRTVSHIALRLFVSYPQIADTALLNLDVTEEDVVLWRKWYAGYKLKDHDHWLNCLADVQSGKLKMIAGQAELFTAALEQDGVDVKKRLEAISAERLRRYEYEHPILVSSRSGSYER